MKGGARGRKIRRRESGHPRNIRVSGVGPERGQERAAFQHQALLASAIIYCVRCVDRLPS